MPRVGSPVGPSFFLETWLLVIRTYLHHVHATTLHHLHGSHSRALQNFENLVARSKTFCGVWPICFLFPCSPEKIILRSGSPTAPCEEAPAEPQSPPFRANQCELQSLKLQPSHIPLPSKGHLIGLASHRIGLFKTTIFMWRQHAVFTSRIYQHYLYQRGNKTFNEQILSSGYPVKNIVLKMNHFQCGLVGNASS
jgi:hypothetical protein